MLVVSLSSLALRVFTVAKAQWLLMCGPLLPAPWPWHSMHLLLESSQRPEGFAFVVPDNSFVRLIYTLLGFDDIVCCFKPGGIGCGFKLFTFVKDLLTFVVILVKFLVTLITFLVTFLVTLVKLIDLIAVVLSFPAEAMLKENAKRVAKTTIVPTLMEFFICLPHVIFVLITPMWI